MAAVWFAIDQSSTHLWIIWVERLVINQQVRGSKFSGRAIHSLIKATQRGDIAYLVVPVID